MYVLYADESGNHNEASHFVLAGVAVFEREAHWITEDFEALQRRYFPNETEPVEFHCSRIRAPEDKLIPPFDSLDKDQRRQLIRDIYGLIAGRRCVLFGVAIEKDWIREGEEPYSRAFEDLVSRFDLFLSRKNSRGENTYQHRGMIVVAESSYRRRLETLGHRFRGGSTRWGRIKNLADVPFFVPTKNTRLLQVADFSANAVYGRYQHGITRDLDLIAQRFDREGPRIHGIVHHTSNLQCPCMACLTRSTAADSG